jgi:hypothetical protein
VSEVRLWPARAADDGVEMDIEVAGNRHRILYACPDVDPGNAAEASVAAALLPAMHVGATVRIDEPVSPKLLGSLPVIQDVVRNWEQRYPSYRRYQRVDVHGVCREPGPIRGQARGAAAFFSGGVDSFYTAIRHLDDIDALILVQGFDFRWNASDLSERVLSHTREAAAALGKPLIEVRTDLRAFSDRYACWEHYHGAALASTAHLLSDRFSTFYIAATHTYAHLSPLGSHPLLDPLWGSEDVELVHDGCEASRIEKLAVLVGHPAATAHLRVCLENRYGAYNCASCEKCLRTMVAMEALGVLDRFPTFPDRIDVAQLRRVRLPVPSMRYTWETSLTMLDAREGDRRLRRNLRAHLYGRSQRLVIEPRAWPGMD